MTPPPPLDVYLLGLIDFEDAQRLQRRLVYDVGETGSPALILCEHPPVISVGRSGSRAHIRVDDDELRGRGVGVRWVNRGGGCVLHLPGQLVAYLALPLQPLGLNLQSYLEGLHRAVVAVLREFDLEARPQPPYPGVFLGQARVASIGVAVNRWITSFGLTLNVSTYLEPFELLYEPGPNFARLRQTSMESRRQRPASMARVRETLIRQLEETFGLEHHYLYTSHPLVHRKPLAHAYASTLG